MNGRSLKQQRAIGLQQARRNALKTESEVAVTELNQKIQRLNEDLDLLRQRIQTLEGTNG